MSVINWFIFIALTVAISKIKQIASPTNRYLLLIFTLASYSAIATGLWYAALSRNLYDLTETTRAMTSD
jgi:hypothetical protein